MSTTLPPRDSAEPVPLPDPLCCSGEAAQAGEEDEPEASWLLIQARSGSLASELAPLHAHSGGAGVSEAGLHISPLG